MHKDIDAALLRLRSVIAAIDAAVTNSFDAEAAHEIRNQLQRAQYACTVIERATQEHAASMSSSPSLLEHLNTARNHARSVYTAHGAETATIELLNSITAAIAAVNK